MSAYSNSRKPRCLHVESCERRIPLAGDVSVALEGSLLKVHGDNLPNEVSVQQNSAGDVSVIGLNGTRINGRSSVVLQNPRLETLDVRLSGGSDRVTIGSVRVANDMNIDGGYGDDVIQVFTPRVGSNLSIKGEAGTDQAHVQSGNVRGDLFVDMGIGTGRITIGHTIVGQNATVITDAAADFVAVSTVTVGGDLNIESKGGDDTISLANLSAYKFTAATDIGNDRITATNVSTLEDIAIETNDGNDTLTLTSVRSGKNISINTGSGNDTVTATNVVAAIDAVLAGGDGFDTFDDNGFFGRVKREVKEFERII